MSGALSIKHGWWLTLTVVLIVWLYSLFTAHLWQRELHHKIGQLNANQASVSLPEPHIETLQLSAITLPDLPVQTAQHNTLAETNPTQTLQAAPEKSMIQPQPDSPATQPVVWQQAQQAPAQTQNAEQIYQQLHSDQALDLQLFLPSDSSKRHQLLTYLYHCAGVQFAILQGQGSQQQLSYLSPRRYVQPSHWLRVANGALSPQEQLWLKNHSGAAVRVFPQAIDQRLSHYIASYLAGAKLSSLRATYQLTSSGLNLSNIELNQQLIKQQWALHHSQCHV